MDVECRSEVRDAQTLQSVSRALDLLEALSEEELGLVELGRRAGLQPSTTHRILATLSERGYVQRRASGRYAVGRRAGYLGISLCAKERDVRTAALPTMDTIRKVSHETVHLTVLDGNSIVFVAQVLEMEYGRKRVPRNFRLPAYASASGKAMMAFSRADRWQSKQRLAPFTRRTITERNELSRELENVREHGWALDKEEYKDEVCCIGAPIFDEGGAVVAAISVSGTPSRITPGLYGDLGELVARGALDVSRALGYEGPNTWREPAD